ncbi:MAG TPA: hypothetical protein VF263_13125 [Longimicrobiaceae bacterium]
MHTSIRRCFLVIATAVCGTTPGVLVAQASGADSIRGTGGGNAGQSTAKPVQASIPWSVEGPHGGRWVLFKEDQDTVEIVVTPGGSSLRNLKVERSTLVNAETGATLRASSLQILGLQNDSAPAGRSSTLKLRVEDKLLPWGEYKGSVRLAAEGREDQTLELTVQRSSWLAWLLGGIAILAGIALAWLANYYLRQLSLRNQALLPAARLKDVVTDLLQRVDDAVKVTGVPLVTLRAHLEKCRGELDAAYLGSRGFVPGRAPSFFGAADVKSSYEEHLDEQGRQVRILDVIVRKGVAAAAEHWPGATDEQRTVLRGRLGELDALPPLVQTPQEAAEKVDEIAARATERKLFRDGAPVGGTPPVREILVQIERVNLTAWGIWAVLTLLVGLMALVFTNYGFGTPLDFCKCLLWGLGLPLAGQQLQNLPANSVTTAFNLTVPR